MAYWQGLLIGFAFVAPIGMQNVYVFNNGLSYKLSRAWLYTFLVWVFDALFCLAAGLLTAYIGWGIIRAANQRALTSDDNKVSLKQAITTAFVVSWANPQALIDGTMMLGASRGTLTLAESVFFIIGVVSASFIWDMGMTTAFNVFRHKIPDRLLLWINLISGIIVVVYGIFLFVEGGKQLF